MEARRREPERREGRLEPVGERETTPEYGFRAGPYFARDLIHWGPVWAGVIGGFATMILLALLGLAVGLAAFDPTAAPGEIATPAAIWSVIIMLVAFFVGGWLAGRTSSYRGGPSAFFLGSMVWALTVTFVVLLASLGFAGALGPALGPFGPAPFAPGPDGATAVAQQTALWGFISLVLAYAAAVAGAYVGSQSTEVEER